MTTFSWPFETHFSHIFHFLTLIYQQFMRILQYRIQTCRPRGCRGCQFWQISLPYLNQGGRLCPPNNTGTPGFSYLLNLLHVHSSWSFSISISLVRWVSAINSMMIPFRTLFSFFGSCIFSRQNQNCFQIQIFRCHIVLAFTFKIRSISWLLRQNLSSK